MARTPQDAGECQMCEDEPATETVAVSIGGIPVGPLFVCEGCADE